MEKTIQLTVNKKPLSFKITMEDFNNYQNVTVMNQNDMVGNSHNFLMRTVDEKNRAVLLDILNTMAGSALEIAGTLINEFKQPLEITVGKSID